MGIKELFKPGEASQEEFYAAGQRRADARKAVDEKTRQIRAGNYNPDTRNFGDQILINLALEPTIQVQTEPLPNVMNRNQTPNVPGGES